MVVHGDSGPLNAKTRLVPGPGIVMEDTSDSVNMGLGCRHDSNQETLVQPN